MTIEKDIPSYSIFVNPNDLKELRRDIWSEDPISANLTKDGKQVGIGMVYRGSHIRKFKKKSYRIIFPKMFEGIKEVHFNAEYMDKSLIRNKLSLDFFASIGVLSPESRHIALNTNGKYQGVYLQLESVDKYFLKRRELPAGQIFYAEDDDANFSLISPFDEKIKKAFDDGYSCKESSGVGRGYLSELIYKINTTPRAEFENEIVKYIDINKYLRWLAGVVCTQNFDGFIHNYALYRNSSTGLFEMIPWDYDATWGRDINGKRMDYDFTPIKGYNTLTARVLDISLFRKRYQRLLNEVLKKEFTVAFLNEKMKAMHEVLRPYVLRDPYIKDSITDFDNEIEFIGKFIRDRNRYLKNHLSELD